jgi:hypothetical protein
VMSTIWSIRAMAARHQLETVFYCASFTMTSASTGAAGGSCCTRTPPPLLTGQAERFSAATGRQSTVGSRAPHRRAGRRVSFAMSMGPPAEGCCQGDGTTPVAS